MVCIGFYFHFFPNLAVFLQKTAIDKTGTENTFQPFAFGNITDIETPREKTGAGKGFHGEAFALFFDNDFGFDRRRLLQHRRYTAILFLAELNGLFNLLARQMWTF